MNAKTAHWAKTQNQITSEASTQKATGLRDVAVLIRAPRTKANHGYIVPINELLFAVVKHRPTSPDYVFVNKRSAQQAAQSAALELCLNLGDADNQAARFAASSVTSTPSVNLVPSMSFGN